jgi:hypothetical protein
MKQTCLDCYVVRTARFLPIRYLNRAIITKIRKPVCRNKLVRYV